MNTAMNHPVAENADLPTSWPAINFSQRALLNGVTQSHISVRLAVLLYYYICP